MLDIHRASNGTYGKRRITAELRLGYGMAVNLKAVSTAMRSASRGFQHPSVSDAGRRATGRPPATWWPGGSLAMRLISCGSRTSPSTPPGEGKLYCCTVLDAHSRRVVGWSIDSRHPERPGDQRARDGGQEAQARRRRDRTLRTTAASSPHGPSANGSRPPGWHSR